MPSGTRTPGPASAARGCGALGFLLLLVFLAIVGGFVFLGGFGI